MVQVGLEGCELQMQPRLPMPVVSCHLALDSTQPCVCAVQLCHPSLWCCHLSVSLLDMPQIGRSTVSAFLQGSHG